MENTSKQPFKPKLADQFDKFGLNGLMPSSFEPRHEISNNEICATSKVSDRPVQKRSLIRDFASRLNML